MKKSKEKNASGSISATIATTRPSASLHLSRDLSADSAVEPGLVASKKQICAKFVRLTTQLKRRHRRLSVSSSLLSISWVRCEMCALSWARNMRHIESQLEDGVAGRRILVGVYREACKMLTLLH